MDDGTGLIISLCKDVAGSNPAECRSNLLLFLTFILFMARRSVIERQKKRVVLSKKYSALRRYLKGKIINSVRLDEKLFYHSLLQKLPTNSSLVRLMSLILYFVIFIFSSFVICKYIFHYSFLFN